MKSPLGESFFQAVSGIFHRRKNHSVLGKTFPGKLWLGGEQGSFDEGEDPLGKFMHSPWDRPQEGSPREIEAPL